MPKRIFLICIYLILIGLTVGCGSRTQEAAQQDEQYSLILTEVEEKRESAQNPTQADSSLKAEAATSTPRPAVTDPPVPTSAPMEWVDSAAAGDHLGEVITIRVEVSHCAYKPGVNGEPTFCNDQSYPNHMFTYLIWGEDWSHYDQACVLVSGEIVEYDGKAQIELENEEQIILCDGT